MELTDNGYETASYSTIYNEIVSDIQEQIPNLSLDDSNPLIKIIKKNADMLNSFSLLGLQTYSSYAIKDASGKALDDRVEWLVTRSESEKSSGEVTFTGTAGTVIPSSFRVSTQSADNIYYTLANVTIGDDGTGTVSVESVDSGESTKVDADTVTKIVNPLSGVSSVTNEDVISGGSDEESDASLRERFYVALKGLGLSTLNAMTSNLLSSTTATKVSIIENYTDEYDDTTELPAHTFRCYVLGGDEDDILSVIYNTRPIGIQPMGDIETYYDTYVSRFSRPTAKSLNFSITLTTSSSAITDLEDTIKENIIDAIDLIDMGGKIDYTLFITALYKNTESSIISFSDLQFWEDDSEDVMGLGDYIQCDIGEYATILEDNITIEVSE